MPKSKRDRIKQKCDSLINAIERALSHAGGLMEVYYPDYPDYYVYIQTWIDALRAIKESVENFREGV